MCEMSPEVQQACEDHLRAVWDRVWPGWSRHHPGMADTPGRVLRMWEEFSKPPEVEEILSKRFETVGPPQLIIQTEIPFRGLCEHHLLPFSGKADIGYIPSPIGDVVGLSKLSRLVKALGAERPNIQETLTNRIATELYSRLGADGVIVRVSAEHTCMTVRGVQAPGVQTITTALRGVFETDPAAKAEFYRMLQR